MRGSQPLGGLNHWKYIEIMVENYEGEIAGDV
jgi:hypothetical protein